MSSTSPSKLVHVSHVRRERCRLRSDSRLEFLTQHSFAQRDRLLRMPWFLCYRAKLLRMPCRCGSCVSGHAVLPWCLCMLCVMAMMQSRLTRAAGHWQQHRASMIQLRSRTLLSRTNTTGSELYYLRHVRSCAAPAMGSKGGNPSPSTALQISGADFIGRLLQSICQQVFLTIIMHSVRLLLMSFLPLARLLQSIRQMVELSMASLAVIPYTLTWLTPLELAAWSHVANAGMHWELFT